MTAAEESVLARREWMLLAELYQRDCGYESWQTQTDNDGALVAYLGAWCRPEDYDESAYASYRHPLQLAEQGTLQYWRSHQDDPAPARNFAARRDGGATLIFRDQSGGLCDMIGPVGDIYDPVAGWTVKPTLGGAQGRGQVAAYMVWVPRDAVVCGSTKAAFRTSSLVMGPCIWTAGELPSGLLPCCPWEDM